MSSSLLYHKNYLLCPNTLLIDKLSPKSRFINSIDWVYTLGRRSMCFFVSRASSHTYSQSERA